MDSTRFADELLELIAGEGVVLTEDLNQAERARWVSLRSTHPNTTALFLLKEFGYRADAYSDEVSSARS